MPNNQSARDLANAEMDKAANSLLGFKRDKDSLTAGKFKSLIKHRSKVEFTCLETPT